MSKIRVLYIDDSETARRVFCDLLEMEGMEVVATGDPEEGLRLALEKAPDLVVVDLRLEERDGCEVVKSLRSNERLRDVPLVALSATIAEEDRRRCEPFVDAFLDKVRDSSELGKRIRDILSSSNPRRMASGETGGGSERSVIPEDAKSALEALEKIRAAMSHDLRTPLTVMISYAHTVAAGKVGPVSEKQKEMLQTVVDHGFQMDALIEEIVKIARKTLEKYGYRKEG
ncbi:MAG: response regulator [Candidatus Geothermincolales bacterium]